MIKNKKMIWVIIGIVVLLLYTNQPKEKGFKKQAGETFQVGYTGSTNSRQYLYTSMLRGQTFTPLNDFVLSSIKLRLSKGGSPIGALTIGVRDTSGGLPIGIDLSSTSIPVSDITPPPYSVYTFNMPPISLITGTKYAIVAYGVEGSNSSNSISIYFNITDEYPDGEYIWSLTSLYPTRDAYFEVWGSTIEEGNVVFRTNAVLPLLGEPGKWIAVKYDARTYTPTSGLTSYKYYNWNGDCAINGIDPATYTLFPYSLSNGASVGYDDGLSSPFIFVWDPHYFNNSECPSNYYTMSWYKYNDTMGAELSPNPTEPYTSNGQEVIEGPSQPSNVQFRTSNLNYGFGSTIAVNMACNGNDLMQYTSQGAITGPAGSSCSSFGLPLIENLFGRTHRADCITYDSLYWNVNKYVICCDRPSDYKGWIYNIGSSGTETSNSIDSAREMACTIGPVCGDGICETGENCPSDATGCPDNPCYEPTCTNGCGEVLVADGGTDESCVSPNYCNGAGICSSLCDVTFNEFISISNAWVGCTAGGCV